MTEEFKFQVALRERVAMLIGLAGPSGSGKTLSALMIARGLCGDDSKIYGIDTEQGRMRHYACAPGEKPGRFKFGFNYLSLGAPFTPERYAAAILAAEKAGAEVIIVDSMSHEHEGVGGILEAHEAALTRMAKDDYGKREALKFAAWIEPKKRHNQLVNTMLQRRPHMVFAFRAKEKLKMVKNERGRNEPTNMGWTAICSDRFEYEMTMLLMLPPGSKGVPDLSQPHNKVNQDHQALVAEYAKAGKGLDEAFGKELAKWAAGGAPAAPKAEGPQSVPPPTDYFSDLPSDDVGDNKQPELPKQPTGEEDLSQYAWGWPQVGDPPEVWKAQTVAALKAMRMITSPIEMDKWQMANRAGLERMQQANPEAHKSVVEKIVAHANGLEGA